MTTFPCDADPADPRTQLDTIRAEMVRLGRDPSTPASTRAEMIRELTRWAERFPDLAGPLNRTKARIRRAGREARRSR